MVLVMLIAVDLLHLPRSAAIAPEPESAAQPGRTSPFPRRPSSKHLLRTLRATPLFPKHAFFSPVLLGVCEKVAHGAPDWARRSADPGCAHVHGEVQVLLVKSGVKRTDCRSARLVQLTNCQGELRPIFSDEKRRGLALRSGALRTRPTQALEVHLGALDFRL